MGKLTWVQFETRAVFEEIWYYIYYTKAAFVVTKKYYLSLQILWIMTDSDITIFADS